MLGSRPPAALVASAALWLPLVATSSARAAVNAWSQVGPPGRASVCAIVSAPNAPERLYAGLHHGGPYRSADGGATWTPVGGGLYWENICGLAVDPGEPERLLAVETSNGRLRRSIDGGEHWVQIPVLGSDYVPLSDVAFSPLAPGVAYLATWTELLRSEDGGGTWQVVSVDLPMDLIILGVHPHPTRASEVWLTTSPAGLLVSTDGGAHFAPRNVGLSANAVFDLAFDPTDPDRALVSGGQALYRTDDGGSTWSLSGPSTVIYDVDFDSLGVAWLVRDEATLFRSVDSGATWNPVAAAPRAEFVTAVGAQILLHGPVGIQRSVDGGESWSARDDGLDAAVTGEVLALRGPSTRLLTFDFAWNDDGFTLLDTTDGGASWRARSVAGLGFPGSNVHLIAADENDPRRLAIFGSFSGAVGGESPFGPLRSEDGGASWTRSSSAGLWDCLWPRDIAFDAVERDRIALLGSPFTESCNLAPEGRCLAARSFDGGQTWSCLNPPAGPAPREISALVAAPGRPGALLGLSAAGLERSLDFGETWQVVAVAPPNDDFRPSGPVWSSPDHAWQGTTMGKLLRSTDGGATWTVLPGIGPGIQFEQIAVDTIRPETIYLRTAEAVFASDDGGESFLDLSAGLPKVILGRLVVDPLEPDRIYLGTLGAGILEYQRQSPRACVPNDEVHCLRGGRFEARVLWQDFEGFRGRGRALPLTDETGAFWFFNPANYELAVKLLDGRPLTDSFWTFFASLSNVEYRLLVTDSETGASRGYFNPAGRFASVGDVNSLPAEGALATAAPSSVQGLAEEAALSTECAAGPGTLCLRDGRFALEATWADFDGGSGSAVAVPLSSDTGAFWFFDDANVELLVKVLDGTGTNGHFWVFFGALSNVEFELVVRDLWTGAEKIYRNPPGRHASVGDVDAFLP